MALNTHLLIVNSENDIIMGARDGNLSALSLAAMTYGRERGKLRRRAAAERRNNSSVQHPKAQFQGPCSRSHSLSPSTQPY
jgi:hypothetical protein